MTNVAFQANKEYILSILEQNVMNEIDCDCLDYYGPCEHVGYAKALDLVRNL